jgi:hypothetical protein
MAAILRAKVSARHRWLHAPGKASLVEILERSGGCSRSRGDPWKSTFREALNKI